MVKINNLALLAILGHGATTASAECDGIVSSFTGTCDYASFVLALDPSCNVTDLFPQDEVDDLTPEESIEAMCALDAPVQFVEIQGTYQLDRRYFAGGGPLVDGGKYLYDSARLKRFEANVGQNSVISFPNYAARVQYNINTGRATVEEPNGYPANMNLFSGCDLKTVMCCFTDDLGESTFEDNIDVTTGVCHHDLYNSPESSHIKEGWSVFEDVETHCVGFTWTEGDDELLGNMMYDVSLRNTANKGYTKGIPGGPMCGCIEHMPVVEEAACKTATRTGEVKYTFVADSLSGTVSAHNEAVITYASCPAGDLRAQVIANDAAAADAISEHLVGTDGCAGELVDYLNDEQFLHQGQHLTKYVTPDPTEWSELVVGEGIDFLPPDYDHAAADARFRGFLDAGCVDENDAPRACIVRRTCASCQDFASDVYYRRFTALPTPEEMTALVDNRAQLDFMTLLYLFTDEWVKDYNDMAAGDFRLYSSYEDALADENAWTYCNYGNYDGYGFPRNCGPSGGTHNWNSYVRRGGGWAEHHGFYVELP